MKFQVTDSFFNVNKYGEHKLVKVGTYQTAKQYAALTPAKKAKCKPVQTQRELFSEVELDLAISLYIHYSDNGATCVANNSEAIAQLVKINNLRPSGSFSKLFNQIRGLDSHAPQAGLDNPSQTLVKKLHQVDPNRFPSTFVPQLKVEKAIDNLLKEILG
jgi:hypothetical protein